MGRLLHLPRRRSPLYAVEETIAALHEELELTTNFAHAMVREANYHAAAEVIDEQRRSLVRASERIERVLRAPEVERTRMRTRAALTGLAAVLALGSGAFAAFGPGGSSPPTRARIEAIQEFGEALDRAISISDPIQLSAIVVSTQDGILAAAQTDSSDPAVQASLLDSVKKLQRVLGNPHLPAPVRERAEQVAEAVTQIVVGQNSIPEIEGSDEPPAGAPAAPTP